MTRVRGWAGVATAALLCSCGTAAAAGGVSSPAHLTMLAAASLSAALSAVGDTPAPAVTVSYAFAGSQQLVGEVAAGAPADVIATADTASMGKLAAAGLVRTPRIFARNTLEIAVAPGNPRHLRGLADLSDASLAVVLADPSVPAGHLAAQVLSRAGVVVRPRSLELDVESALRTVESGDADAAIVYATDVRAAAGRVEGVAIPAAANAVTAYPIALVAAGRAPAAAELFVQDVLHGAIHAALLARGFLAP